jgi:hypothetical protein
MLSIQSVQQFRATAVSFQSIGGMSADSDYAYGLHDALATYMDAAATSVEYDALMVIARSTVTEFNY